VLVDDDNRALADNRVELLADEGCAASAAYTGEQALAAAAAERFDFVLTDVRMPGISGVELVAELARRDPHATYLLMTAYSSDRELRQADALGVVRAVLAEPLAVEKLLGTLPGRRGGAEVLIVDRDRGLAEGLRASLAGHGYAVRVAGSAAGARAAIGDALPDLAIIDVGLPDGHGVALAHELCERAGRAGPGLGDRPCGPRVVVTGPCEARGEPALRGLAPRVLRFLTRPAPAESLLTLLRGLDERGER
jgi:DNA-binding response OmpR family regulator